MVFYDFHILVKDLFITPGHGLWEAKTLYGVFLTLSYIMFSISSHRVGGEGFFFFFFLCVIERFSGATREERRKFIKILHHYSLYVF